MKFFIINTLISALIKLLTLFSRQKRMAFAYFMADLILKYAHKTRKRAMSNISLAMPELTEQQVKELVFKSYRAIVYGVTECFWLDELDIDIECDEETLKLLHMPEGAAIATMHMSCYEVAPVAVERLIGSAVTLSKIPPYIKSAQDIYTKSNITVINTNEPNAFVRLLNISKDMGAVCLHSDHYSNNISLEFFGRETGAPSGVAMVSAYKKSPLLICYAVLQSNGKYKAVIETVIKDSVENSTESINDAMNKVYRRFEEIIRRYPEQWYWSYNRWRE